MSFTFNEKAHYYELDGKRMYGVTTVLGVIAKPALIGWAARMATEYVRDHLKSMDDLEQVLELAKNAHTKKKEAAGSSGKDTHALIEEWVKRHIGNDLSPSPEAHEGLQAFIQWAYENKVKFIASEEKMYSKDWWTAGTCDLILEMGGKRYIGDVKTQAKLWDNTPHIQCAAYAKMYKEMHGKDIDGTIIILIPRETSQVETHVRYNLEGDIKAFEAALLLYKTLPAK
jgi:hypothetical protein